jgi:hypothetical protein
LRLGEPVGFTPYERSAARSVLQRPPPRPSNKKPKLYARSTGIIAVRAPVAQWIERRPPEPDRLSVVATRVGPRAKRVEFYALRSGFLHPHDETLSRVRPVARSMCALLGRAGSSG